MDEFFADDDTKVYWVTFLDGLQRVLLFTEDLEIAVEAQEVRVHSLTNHSVCVRHKSRSLSSSLIKIHTNKE